MQEGESVSGLNDIINRSHKGRVDYDQLDPVLNHYLDRLGRSTGLIYIGANTGQEMCLCKSLADKVYAFEAVAVPSVWNRLIQHQDHKTQCFNVALSDTEGSSLLFPSSNNFESSSLLNPGTHLTEFAWVHFGQPITVRTQRLDSFDFVNHCDTIIMDVQGAELRVLNGLTDFGNVKLIILEYTSPGMYHGAATFDEIESKLIGEGFSYEESFGVYDNPGTGVYAGNAVFVRDRGLESSR